MRGLLYKASAAYPNQIELEDEIVAVYIERLLPVPFDVALNNLNRHIDNSRFFPTVAELAQQDVGSIYDSYKQLGQDAVLQLEERQRQAIPMPKELFKEWLDG